MLSRFKEELNGILRKKNIHLSSGILEDALLQLADVQHDELTESAQKRSKNAIKLHEGDEQKCFLNITDMKPAAKNKLCKLLAIDADNHFEGSPFSVTNESIRNILLPKFIEGFNKLSAD